VINAENPQNNIISVFLIQQENPSSGQADILELPHAKMFFNITQNYDHYTISSLSLFGTVLTVIRNWLGNFRPVVWVNSSIAGIF
jgi:hypothetical protein